MTLLLFFFQITASKSTLPGTWLGRSWRYSFGFLSCGTDGRWCLHPQFWWSLGLCSFWNQFRSLKRKPAFKILEGMVFFQDHKTCPDDTLLFDSGHKRFYFTPVLTCFFLVLPVLGITFYWGQEHLQADFANAYLGGGVLSGGTRHVTHTW